MTSPPQHNLMENQVRRLLLDSATDDSPSPAASRKARTAALMAVSAAATSTAAATALSASSVRWLAFVKWIGAGALGGLSTVAVVRHFDPAQSAPTDPISSIVSTASPSQNLVPVASPWSVEPVVSSPPEPVAPAYALPPRPLAMSPSLSADYERPTDPPMSLVTVPDLNRSDPPHSATLAEEVSTLDHARRAVLQGRYQDALRELDAYHRDYHGGRLGHEAMFVRIEALMKSGQKGEANQLAERFLQAHPATPLASRLRALVGSPSPSSSSHAFPH